MSRNKLLLVVAVLLIFAALSLQNQIKTTGKVAFEISGSFQTVDEPPKLNRAIPNYSLKPSENVTVNINLSTYFKELNKENMTFSYTAPTQVNISLDNATGTINLTLQQDWKGRANITVTAFDSSNNNFTSNDIVIIIREVNITKSTFDSITAVGFYEGQSSGKMDINSLADGELENSTEIVIEKYDNGKISFAEPISINQDINLNANINISNNHIEINSSALPEFDKPATLSFYNLTLTNPRILKDGVLCPAAECKAVNYISGVFIFNVTGFTAYSAEETPVEEAASAGGGGGGPAQAKKRGPINVAPFAKEPKPGFETDSYKIETSVKQNRVKKEVIKVSNPTDKDMEISIGLTKNIDFIHKEDKVTLAPGETKDIELIIAPTDENKPDTYTTQLVLKKDDISRYVPLIITVQSLLQLMDASMEIYSEDKTVYQEDNLLMGLKLFNLGESDKISVDILWQVKDFNDNILLKDTSKLDVETQTAFVKKLFIPSTIEPGEYMVVAIATYNDSSTITSSSFNVAKKQVIEQPISPERGIIMRLVIVAAAIALLIIILIIMILYERRKINELVRNDKNLMEKISGRLRLK